jgi:murein DD-endopeptidase MepM/ murein hydrolase activator NlpD
MIFMNRFKFLALPIFAACCLAFSSCKTGPVVNLFKGSSPHELYLRKLNSAGLDKTAMGRAWKDTSDLVLNNALAITIPYKESGYFAAERIPAASFKFQATRGQKISISLSKVPDQEFMVYMDVWEVRDDKSLNLVGSADTLGSALSIDADENRTYLLRLQPELLRSGSYTLQISNGPSLNFPVKTSGTKPRIESLFGVGRDANSRKHEGIDILDNFHTPVIASANGTVTRVSENKLGGLVVMMRPEGKNYTLYYAHLDKQIAREGQQVVVGDTLGLMGKTGNARTTAPHLHFGIYTSNGTIDPYPFVNPSVSRPLPVTASTQNLNATLRSKSKIRLYSRPESQSQTLLSLPAATVMHIEAATSSWYKASLPNGQTGYLHAADVTPVNTGLRKLQLSPDQQFLYDQPNATAAIKKDLPAGSQVNLLGSFENYFLVRDQDNEIGWLKAK